MRCNSPVQPNWEICPLADKGFMQNCAHSAVPRWKRMISSVLIVVILAQGLSVLTAIPLISAVFAENVIVL